MRCEWDRYDAYLFDIDGTLLHCKDAVHYFAFCRILCELAGRPLNLDGVNAHGNTDVGILRDALLLAGVPDAAWRPQLPRIRDALCSYVEEHASEFLVETLPGAAAVLAHLRARGARLGVATGNLERIGWAKLTACGLASAFHFGGFSDAYEHRADVLRAALEQTRTLAGEAARVCVVGDTPADLRAAHANGLDIIAVATGVYTEQELRREEPELLIGSLEQLLPRS